MSKNISSSKSRNCQKVSTVLKNVIVVINKMFVNENVLSFSVALLLRGRTVCDWHILKSDVCLLIYPFNLNVWMCELGCEDLNCSIFVLFVVRSKVVSTFDKKKSLILIKLERSWNLTAMWCLFFYFVKMFCITLAKKKKKAGDVMVSEKRLNEWERVLKTYVENGKKMCKTSSRAKLKSFGRLEN